MKKIFLTYCDYPQNHEKRLLYEKYTKPRFLEYCRIHDFIFVEIKENCAAPYNLGFAKVFWIQQHWDEFKTGDIITYADIDCCIMDATKPFVFDKHFAITMESTGVLCMGGLWSLQIGMWSNIFINEMCSIQRQAENKDLQSWNTWHENDAVYHVLGLNWGEGWNKMGTRYNTPFSQSVLFDYVEFLPANYGCTYQNEDVDWTKNNHKLGDQSDPDWIYKIVSQYAVPDRHCNFDEIIVRHLSAGTMALPWANRYYNTKMKT